MPEMFVKGTIANLKVDCAEVLDMMATEKADQVMPRRNRIVTFVNTLSAASVDVELGRHPSEERP